MAYENIDTNSRKEVSEAEKIKLEKEMKIYRKYKPDSKLSDIELRNQLLLWNKFTPKKADFEEYSKNTKKLWDRFKGLYPHADISKFIEVDKDGKSGLYFQGWKIYDENGKSDKFENFSDPIKKEQLMEALGPRARWPQFLSPSTENYVIPPNDFRSVYYLQSRQT